MYYSLKQLNSMGFKVLGSNVLISKLAKFINPSNITLKNNIRIDDYCFISANSGIIDIGNYVHISRNTSLISGSKIILSDFSGISNNCSIFGKSDREFNSWFNDMFEKVKVNDDENDHGYEEWYKKGEIEKQRKVHLSEFGREFEKKKQQCKSVVVHKGIQDIDSKSGYSLTREKPQEYSSSIFSKLQYEDLKKAHTESVVPVTRADFDNKPKFASIDSYIQHREQQSTTPLSLQQANKYLSERTTNDNKQSMQRAFALIKRDQAVEKSNNDWWQNFKTLKN